MPVNICVCMCELYIYSVGAACTGPKRIPRPHSPPAKQAADAAALLLLLPLPLRELGERAQNKNRKSGRLKRDLKTRLRLQAFLSFFLKKKILFEFCNSFFVFFLTDCFGELNSNERAQFLFLFVTLSFATLTCVLYLASGAPCHMLWMWHSQRQTNGWKLLCKVWKVWKWCDYWTAKSFMGGSFWGLWLLVIISHDFESNPWIYKINLNLK